MGIATLLGLWKPTDTPGSERATLAQRKYGQNKLHGSRLLPELAFVEYCTKEFM